MSPILVEKIELTELVDNYFTRKGKIYSFLNPVSYLNALKHKDLFCKLDGLFVDGSLLVMAIKMLYGKKVTRRSFDMTSMAPQLFENALRYNNSIYIVASKQEQVEKAVKIYKERYPNINIIGYRNGYFANIEEQDEEVRHIVELNPDYLIVGMGVVVQENFLFKVKEAGFKGIGFTCGGFIHQTASNMIDYYPAWIDRMNLRFLYRMYKEPHTRKRYFKAGVVFPILFVKERLFG